MKANIAIKATITTFVTMCIVGGYIYLCYLWLPTILVTVGIVGICAIWCSVYDELEKKEG